MDDQQHLPEVQIVPSGHEDWMPSQQWPVVTQLQPLMPSWVPQQK